MVALRSLGPAVSSLARNPLLLVVTAAFGLIQVPQFALQSVSPIAASIASLLLTGVLLVVLPFYQGGLLALAEEARTGRARWQTFLDAGTANYVGLLLAYLVVLAVATAFGILLVGVLLVGGLGAFAAVAGGGAADGGSAVAFALVGLVVAFVGLAYLLTMFFIQFYGHAIVLEDADVIGSFKRSVAVVRENLLAVAGYTLVAAVGGVVLGAVAAAASLLFVPEGPISAVVPSASPVLLVVGAVVFLGLSALFGAFYATYSVTVYRELTLGSVV